MADAPGRCRAIASIRVGIAAAALVGLAAPGAAARAPTVSWGKAGVALQPYRDDALACGLLAYNTDLSGTEQAAILREASDQLKTLDGTGGTIAATGAGAGSGGSYAGQADPLMIERGRREGQIIQTARPEKQIREADALMHDRLAACLAGRGYTRFALTDAQDQELARLKPGSDARRAFLHALASDPDVLAAQAVTAPAGR